MKYVKLFENWAEENVELPEYLDPNVHTLYYNQGSSKVSTLFNPSVLKKIKNNKHLDFCIDEDDIYDEDDVYDEKIVTFKSFSDYDFWRKDGYDKILLNQTLCRYKLEDCFGIPKTGGLGLRATNIKSMRGLEDKEFENIFLLGYSKLENLKYCPVSTTVDFHNNPLLSYYGIKSQKIESFKLNLCGELTYEKAGYDDKIKMPKLEQLNDPKFNANIFCHFLFEVTNSEYSNGIQFNPWNQIYDDPNEVENYDFLFMPFYDNSEKFRDKVKEYLPNIDLSGVTIGRADLW